MAVLGVDQQIVFVWQWFARPRVDWIGPHHDFGFVVRAAVFGDQVAIPFGMTEHREAVWCIEQRAFFAVDSWAGGIGEQHVGALDKWKSFGVPPHRVSTIVPVPKPGQCTFADWQRFDRKPIESFVDSFSKLFLQRVHSVRWAVSTGMIDRTDQFNWHLPSSLDSHVGRT